MGPDWSKSEHGIYFKLQVATTQYNGEKGVLTAYENGEFPRLRVSLEQGRDFVGMRVEMEHAQVLQGSGTSQKGMG